MTKRTRAQEAARELEANKRAVRLLEANRQRRDPDGRDRALKVVWKVTTPGDANGR